MILYALEYKYYGITYGSVIGSVFFIPRVIWFAKPMGSGIMLGSFGNSFTNGSSPLIAEGLINFGAIGVMLFGFCYGKLVAYLDMYYWKHIYDEQRWTYLTLIYPFCLSMFFFMLRGDLMSSFAFSTGHLVVYSVMFWLNNNVFRKMKLGYEDRN